MEWFRFYTKTLESAKVQKLPDKLFKAWVNFMCIARIFDGVLPSHTEIAFRLRISPERALKLTHELKKAGLIDDACDQKRAYELKRNGRKDMLGDRFLVMHDWDQWQCVSDDSAARKSKQRSYGKLSRDIDRDIHGTSPVLEQNRTDTEQKQSRADAVVVPMPTFEKDREAAWQWFLLEYTGELHGDYDCQIFISVIQAREDISDLRRNLPLWKASEKWQAGYAPTAENFLRKRIFKDAPMARDPPKPKRKSLDEIAAEVAAEMEAEERGQARL